MVPANLRMEVTTMGDKSQKAKDKSQKQKSAAEAGTVASARAKQAGYSHGPQAAPKGKK